MLQALFTGDSVEKYTNLASQKLYTLSFEDKPAPLFNSLLYTPTSMNKKDAWLEQLLVMPNHSDPDTVLMLADICSDTYNEEDDAKNWTDIPGWNVVCTEHWKSIYERKF
jgi:putative lipase involved disintegration of autophagic bodies